MKNTSRFLSMILRHKPESIGIKLDKEGWAKVDEILRGLLDNGHDISLDLLKKIVAENDKQRFAFNSDYTKIRANQGHSIEKVDLKLKVQRPPSILYHGTAKKYLSSILKEGLVKKNRNHVHLSDNIDTAKKVGARHGEVVILKIESNAMFADSYKFYLSDNGVWLTDNVPVKYIKQI